MNQLFAMLLTAGALVLGGCASQQTMQSRAAEYRGLLTGQMRHSEAAIQSAVPDKFRDYRRGSIKLNAAVAAVDPAKIKEVEDGFKFDMAEMLAKCEAVLGRFEGRADRARQAQLVTALLGTVAGAVIVPALSASASASKSAIAGWGGLSGATNTAQHLIKDVGLDAASLIAARQKVADNLTQAIHDYDAATTSEDKKKAILKGYAGCIAYAVTASTADISNPVPEGKGDGKEEPGPKDGEGKK